METVSTLNVRQGTGKEPQREDCIIKYRCSCCAAVATESVVVQLLPLFLLTLYLSTSSIASRLSCTLSGGAMKVSSILSLVPTDSVRSKQRKS